MVNIKSLIGLGRQVEKNQKAGESVNFNGVYLPKAKDSSQAAKPMENFVYHTTTLSWIKDIAHVWSIGQIPIIFSGTGMGKTEIFEQMGALAGYTPFKLTITPHTDESDVYGVPNLNVNYGKAKEDGTVDDAKYKFIASVIWKAITVPDGQVGLLLLDEYLFADPRYLSIFNELFDAYKKGSKFHNPVTGEDAIVLKSKLKIGIATNNPGGKYFGRNPLGPDQIDRFVRINSAEQLNEADDLKLGLADILGENLEIPDASRINREDVLSLEEFREIPGIVEIVSQFIVFLREVEKQDPILSKDDPQKNGFSRGRTLPMFKEFIRRNYGGKELGNDILACAREAARLLVINKFKGDPNIPIEQDTGPRGAVYNMMLSTLNWTPPTNPNRNKIRGGKNDFIESKGDMTFWTNPLIQNLLDKKILEGVSKAETGVIRLELSKYKRRPLVNLLKDGKYKLETQTIQQFDRPEDRIGNDSLDVGFLSFGGFMSTSEILAICDSLELRPLNAHELFILGIEYSEIEKNLALVALETSLPVAGEPFYPCIIRSDSEWIAFIHRHDYQFIPRCRFPVVRK